MTLSVKNALQAIVTAAFLTLSAVALADCDVPAGPIIPDGNVASQDELVAAQQAMKAYQDQLVGYRECVDGLQKALDPEAETSAEETVKLNALYDASVDAEDAVAQEFNTAVRAFKARQ